MLLCGEVEFILGRMENFGSFKTTQFVIILIKILFSTSPIMNSTVNNVTMRRKSLLAEKTRKQQKKTHSNSHQVRSSLCILKSPDDSS